MVAKNNEIGKTIEESPTANSYANRVHSYLAHLSHKARKYENHLIREANGDYKFRGHSAVAIRPIYLDSEIPTSQILKLLNEGNLPERYKRAQVKALARIGLLYFELKGSNYHTDEATSRVQIINDFLARKRNGPLQRKKPRFIQLYEYVKKHLEDSGSLPSISELERMCEECLVERLKDFDPTRKFRARDKRKQDKEETYSYYRKRAEERRPDEE